MKCPECGGDMHKRYNNEDIEKILKQSKLKGYVLTQYELDLRRVYQCIECKFAKYLSVSEIIKVFVRTGSIKQKTIGDIIQEVKEERGRIEEKIRKDNNR